MLKFNKILKELKDFLLVIKDHKRAFVFGLIIFCIFLLFCTFNFKQFGSNQCYYNFLATIIQGFIAGGITFWAMKVIDRENKNRWELEGYIKRKIEIEICIRKELFLLKTYSELLPTLNDLKIIEMMEIENIDLALLTSLNAKMYVINQLLESNSTQYNYKNSLPRQLEEYEIFDISRKENFNNFIQTYRKIIGLKYIVLKNENDFPKQLTLGDIDGQLKLFKDAAAICYDFKQNIDALLSIFNLKFKNIEKFK